MVTVGWASLISHRLDWGREIIVFYTPREDWLTLLRDWGRER